MTLQTIENIFFLRFSIFHVFFETHYLREFLRSPCQLLMADHTGIITLICSHGLYSSIMNLPMPMTYFTVNRCMTILLPTTILYFMAIPAEGRPQMHQGQIHLLLYVIAPVVPVIAEWFRNQEWSHHQKSHYQRYNNDQQPCNMFSGWHHYLLILNPAEFPYRSLTLKSPL